MNWDEESVSKLYQLFRAKMHEVYRSNRKVDPFGDSMTVEFNAWQSYLRNSLNLEIAEIDGTFSAPWEKVVCKDGSKAIKIPNPSNGSSFGQECILVPLDFAEKVAVFGQLPDKI